MGRYVIRRLLQMVPLILGITILTFALANLVPGSPVSDLEFNPDIKPEDKQRIIHNLGLDQPVYIRYLQWLGNVVQGDLGISLVTYTPVTKSILQKLPNTLLLTGASLFFALAVSIPVGVYAAVKRNSWFDQITTLGSVAGFAVPTFWLGLMMIIVFSVKLHWLPSGGVYTLGHASFLDRVKHLIMPAFVLGFVQMAGWTRYIRSQMIEVLHQDYMRTAEAKGLAQHSVIFRHGLRNAILPLVTLVALDLPALFGGAVIIEQIFTWNGLGRFILDAASKRDYTVVMGITLFIAVLTVVANLIADIAYGLLDPRIQYS